MPTCHVKQFSDIFTSGTTAHSHPPSLSAGKKVKMAVKVKQIARENIFQSAGEIVEDIMRDMTSADDAQLPKPDNLLRASNRHRQKFRPQEPSDIDFELNRDFIGDDFIVDDLQVDGARHIIFATESQLQHLRQARRWFMDGTFKSVRRPFYQLASIHAFMKSGEDVKQVPLLYILMSRRSKDDYVAILDCIRRRLGNPLVEWIMLDFEAATWQALREVFPGVVLKGCVFHWSQRVFRKIQKVGLATAYMQRGDKFRYLRKLMALPYLPPEHVPAAYEQLLDQAEEVGGPILDLTMYVGRTWVDGAAWKADNWSVFRETVRTNNDVEGWHRRINTRAGRGDLGMYLLAPLL